MADNKKYYYLKLKDNFYDSEEMIILQNMQDGYLYSDILMKLYLRSLKNNGKLMFKDVIPYTPSALAQVVRHQVGTVEKALKIFKDLGLIEVLDNGAIYMLDIQNFIGESSTEADRIRNYRAKIKEDKDGVQMLQQMNNKCNNKSTPEIEKEIKIKKDIDIELEKKKEIKRNKEKEEKRKYIVELYNSTCTKLPQIKKITEKRNKAIDKFIKTFNINEIIEIFNMANSSEFLTGENDRGWKADFDFIMKIDKATAILEGKYQNKKKTGFEDLQKIYEEAKIQDEQTRNNTSNSFVGW